MLLLGLVVFLLALEVIPESRILQVSLNLELLIGKVEEEDAEEVVGKANDGNVEGKLLHSTQRCNIASILYGL